MPPRWSQAGFETSNIQWRRERKAVITPAMGAGISDHVWSLEEVVKLLD
jgi:hypothetical protein